MYKIIKFSLGKNMIKSKKNDKLGRKENATYITDRKIEKPWFLFFENGHMNDYQHKIMPIIQIINKNIKMYSILFVLKKCTSKQVTIFSCQTKYYFINSDEDS